MKRKYLNWVMNFRSGEVAGPMQLNRLTQIDLIKGLVMISVILGHTFSLTYESQSNQLAHETILSMSTSLPSFDIKDIFSHWITYSALITQQAVPILLLVMGLNYSWSYARNNLNRLSDIYSKREIKKRLRRFLIPFAIFFIFLSISGIIWFIVSGDVILQFSSFNLIGFLPVNGPGNFFISLVFQFLLVFPVLHISYRRRPTTTIILAFSISVIFELLFSGYADAEVCILRYLPLLVLGIFLSDNYDLFSKRNRILIVLGLLSAIYLIVVSQFQYSLSLLGFVFVPYESSMSFLAAFYTALLVLLGIKYLPKRVTLWPIHVVSKIGVASYHIFLVQIAYFGVGIAFRAKYSSLTDLLQPYNTMMVLVNLLVCIGGGTLFYVVTKKLEESRQMKTHTLS